MDTFFTSLRGTRIRLFLTCWLVFILHFSTNFVREHYLVLSIAEDHSFRLDKYVGLHNDIFETPNHGAHHGANPGASMIAVIPYIMFKPVADKIVTYINSKRVNQLHEGRQSIYKDNRPARVKFYEQVRKRNLDIKFGLVSFITMVFCMAPLSALGVIFVFQTLIYTGLSNRLSLFMALLYAFGTPIFFRTGYLNQNLMIGIFGFIGFTLLWQQGNHSKLKIPWRYGLAGFLGGLALLCDYSGLVILVLLPVYGLLRLMDSNSLQQALKHSLFYVGGAIGPILLLWFYQWSSFGHPFFPGQNYMPPVDWIDVGYKGFGIPSRDILTLLLFDYRFGLFVCSPILLLAFVAPLLSHYKRSIIPLRETLFILLFFTIFTLFCSCIRYSRLQWVTGIRYIIPVIPFLFLLTVAVLVRIPRLVTYMLMLVTFTESWCYAMARTVEVETHGVLNSVVSVFLNGFQLPWLNTLSKMAQQYAPFLEEKTISPFPFFMLWAFLIYGIWVVKHPQKNLD